MSTKTESSLLNENITCCGYLSSYLVPSNLLKQIKDASKTLKIHLERFDAIAFSGYSGALTAIPLAYEINKPLLVVRKHLNDSHAESIGEYSYFIEKPNSVLIVDEYIDTGAAVRRIADILLKNNIKIYGTYIFIDKCFEPYKANKFPFSVVE